MAHFAFLQQQRINQRLLDDSSTLKSRVILNMLLWPGSAMVEQTTHNPKIEGSNPFHRHWERENGIKVMSLCRFYSVFQNC